MCVEMMLNTALKQKEAELWTPSVRFLYPLSVVIMLWCEHGLSQEEWHVSVGYTRMLVVVLIAMNALK